MIRGGLIALLLLGLSGCVTHRVIPAAPIESPTPEVTRQLQGWSSWRAVGRLAVKSAHEGFNANFEWRQAGTVTDLLVEGPFGAGRSRVHVSPDRIRVEAAGGTPPAEFEPPFVGVDAELVARLGFAIPLHALSYWLRGVPDPTLDSAPLPEGGFSQDGWRVHVDDVMEAALMAVPLPHRVTLTQDEARIRVVIDRWRQEEP